MIGFRSGHLVCAGIVFIFSLGLYGWTLAPTVTLVDSGELIVAANSLGVAHPPGFPLYLLLAHLASMVPIGSVAVRVNFASALFAALASTMLSLVVAESIMITSHLPASNGRLTKQKMTRRRGKRLSRAPGRETGTATVTGSLLVLAPAVGAGLLMAFSRTLWSYATIAEVYTLNTLLILSVFFLMLRWRRHILEDARRSMFAAPGRHMHAITDYDFWLYSAAFVFGLALGVHHVSVALMLPAFALMVYQTEGLRFFASKRLVYAALISLVALLGIYTYLPMAAWRSPLINWGNPRSLQAIWWHITGRQYRVFLSFAPNLVGEQLVEFSRLAFREFGRWWLPLVLGLALVGFGSAFKRDRTTFWLLVLMIIADLGYGVSYVIAEDKDAYYLPAFIALAIAAGFGLRWLLQFIPPESSPAKRYLLAAIPTLLLPAITLASNWSFNNRSHYFIAHDYVGNILSRIEPHGLLLTLDWQVQSPMLYTREIEQRRRDVKVVDINLLRRSWYFDYLKRAYPDLIERSREKVEVFLSDLREWEQDPAAYANDAARTEGIASRFNEMIQSFVRSEAQVAPVYLTLDLIFMSEEQDKKLTEWLTNNYQLIPQGLVFRLASDPGFQDFAEGLLQTRGLADGTLRFEPDDVVNLKVLPAYTNMLVNRGRYLALYNQHDRAVDAFNQALALDPNLDVARQGLKQSVKKLGNQ